MSVREGVFAVAQEGEADSWVSDLAEYRAQLGEKLERSNFRAH